MDHRNGTCSSCGATYKIPSSFAHDKARCKECGGTVEIGTVVSNGGGSEPEPYIPSGKKGSGPSMKERLLASRQAAAAAAKPAANPPPTPPDDFSDDFSDDLAASLPEEKPAKRAGRAAKTPSSGEEPSEKKDVPQAPKSAVRRGRGGRGRGRSKKKTEKKTSGPMVIGIIGVVLLLSGGAFLFREDLGFGGGDSVDAASNVPTELPPNDTEEATAEGDAPEAAAGTDPALASVGSGESPADPEAGEEPEAPPEAAPTKQRDPDTIDLAAIEDFGTVDGTTEEELTELTAQLGFAMNRNLGVKQTRAQKFLEGEGRKAFPLILNHMKGLDYSTEDACQQGMWAQTMLEHICRGANFGWKEYGEAIEGNERYFEWFNKKAVQAWCKSWSQAETSLTAWRNLAKLSNSEYEALLEELGDDAPEASTLDFLGDD